ncbi:MAG: dTMP kinase [Candidatus Thorarchaeota archaeon]
MNRRGALIAIEGIDGSGKTTQAEMLVKRLRQHGLEAELLHEPTESEWGHRIRELARSGRTVSPDEELEYFINDRKWDVTNNIRPLLEQNVVVVMDRYYLSSIAYQGALGIDTDRIAKMNEFAPRPDLVIILDVDPTTGQERIERRKKGRPNYFEDPAYLEKVRMIFRSLEDVLENVMIVDASGSIDEVHETIWNLVSSLLRSLHVEPV